MSKKEFLFKKDTKDKWKSIGYNLKEFITNTINTKDEGFKVVVSKYSPKKSDKQLRSYWMLINSVRKFMNDEGNNFTQEEVSHFFKVKAGHCKYHKHVQIPKSISDKSNTTVDEMKTLIYTVLEFGQEYNITDCYIDDLELQELLTYYER